MFDILQNLCSARYFRWWAVAVWSFDLILTAFIIKKVPFTDIDWETYAAQVDAVLAGQFDYGQLRGPTGPVAYPAGFCWAYGLLRLAGIGVAGAQVVFAGLYLSTLAVVFEIYRLVGSPGWLLVLCMLSKRMHSIYVLRLFNDAVAQFFSYLALLLFLRHRRLLSSLTYSLAVSVKMQPLLYCPAVGLCLVLTGGWLQALALVMLMVLVQLLLAAPFLLTSPWAYFQRAFGGPGDLQHVWSVNWRMLPEAVFSSKSFALVLLLSQLCLLAGFAHKRWIPGGFLSPRLWRWFSEDRLEAKAVACVWFACNFVGIACLRTIHFQFLAWYFHSVPFLAWYGVRPDEHRGLPWVLRCAAVAALALAVEVPYLLTSRGVVRGPDGRSWETDGVPTRHGSVLLLAAHASILALLACRKVHLIQAEGKKEP